MFRHHVSGGTELGRKVDAIMAAGDYVPDEITVAMLAERIEEPDASDGYILDGFPRTAPQVEALDGLIGVDGLDRVVVFDVDEDELVERLLARGRKDDNEETIRTRFQVYLEQTAPLLAVYEDRDVVSRVDGLGEMDAITEQVLEVLV
jgi:adenylate kinase